MENTNPLLKKIIKSCCSSGSFRENKLTFLKKLLAEKNVKIFSVDKIPPFVNMNSARLIECTSLVDYGELTIFTDPDMNTIEEATSFYIRINRQSYQDECYWVTNKAN